MNRKLPPLNALRVFDVVARHLNFRLAAEALGVTQGAVAQQIRGLEALLGLKLFERGPRALVLTAAGVAYLPDIRRAFQLIGDATDALVPRRLQVTVSVVPTFASKWLLPRLADFTAKNPDVDVRIIATERLSDFHDDGVDCAVRLTSVPNGTQLNFELLFEHEIIAVASPQLVGNLEDPVSLAALSDSPLLHDAQSLWPLYLEEMGASVARRNNLRFNQTALAIDAAVAGQGIALVGRLYLQEELKAGRLKQVSSRTMGTASAFHLVRPRRAKSLAVDRFIEWIRRTAREENNLLPEGTIPNGSLDEGSGGTM